MKLRVKSELKIEIGKFRAKFWGQKAGRFGALSLLKIFGV